MLKRHARPTNCSSISPSIDALEPRWLLAFAATDYFPLSTAARWNYSLASGTAARSAVATKVNGKAAVLFKDVVSSGGNKTTISRSYACSAKAGLQILGQADMVQAGMANGVSSFTFGQPLTFLKSSFAVGAIAKWSKVPITGTLPIENTRINVTGTDTGSSKVVGVETITLGSGRVFTNSVKVVLSHTQKGSGTYKGHSGTLTSVITETVWLAKGIGLVKGTSTVSQTLVVPGNVYKFKANDYLNLTSSNRLPSFAQIKSGRLTILGTSANDSIKLSRSSNILTTTVNGKSLCFSSVVAPLAPSINGLAGDDRIIVNSSVGVSIKGGDGNDTIAGGPGNDSIDGGAGSDDITGREGYNEILTDDGEIDTIYAAQPADYLQKDLDDVENPDPLAL